ncbi:hypothetical protein ACROYT_G016746 [Oculina patagonica]
MSASKKSSRISRPLRRPLDDNCTWESLAALTADLAGMSANMAQLASRSSSSLVPPNDSVPLYRASPPPRDTNSVPDVESNNLAQSATPNPPQELDFRRFLLFAKETQMIEVEKLKFQLELARIQAMSISKTPNESNPDKPHELAIFGRPLRPAGNTLPATYTGRTFWHEDLMSLECTYQWSAIRAYHYKVLHTLALGLTKWGDSFDGFKQSFFIPTNLLPSVGAPSNDNAPEKVCRGNNQRPPASQQPSCHQICSKVESNAKSTGNKLHLRKTKEPACTGDNPKPIHMPPKSQLFKSTTSSKSTASPPKISAPLEVQPPKEPHETACSKKPKKSSYPVDVPEQLLAPKPPVDCPVTRSGCTPRPPSHLKDLVVTK